MSGSRSIVLTSCLALALAAPAAASQVSVVSRAEPTLPNEAAGGETPESGRRISADGRYVIFLSTGTHLVPGQVDTNRGTDIFLRDRAAGTTVLVSRSAASPTTAANRQSERPVLSADGRYVAFLSYATDLVAGQTEGNDNLDTFLFDRVTGTVSLVSHTASSPVTTGNAGSWGQLSLSSDGAYVAFSNSSTNLVAGQSGPFGQAYLYDRAAGTNLLVSHVAGSANTGASPWAGNPVVSADGRWVAYESPSPDLVAGSAVSAIAIFLFDRTTGANVLVSHSGGSSTQAGNGNSENARISADGLWVAFQSSATDLLPGVTGNNSRDIFLWERQTGAITLVTRDPSSATTESGIESVLLGISADGGEVLLTSWTPPSTPLGLPNLHLFERGSGTLTLVNHAAGSPGTPSDSYVVVASLSDDGDFVVFETQARDLLPGAPEANRDSDVFLYERSTGTTSLVSRVPGTTSTYPPGISERAEISGGGGHVVFDSAAALATGARDFNGDNDVYVHDRATGAADLVSRFGDGPPATAGSWMPAVTRSTIVSADGRWVAFSSSAPNLVPGQVEDEIDPTGTSDVFLRDRATGTTVLVSRRAGAGPAATASGGSPVISADGRWIAFLSSGQDLVVGQSGPAVTNVFLFDRDTGEIILVSHAAGSATTGANKSSLDPEISADGSRVLFRGGSTDLGATDTNGTDDLFLFDRGTGEITLVSHAAGAAGTAANGASGSGRLSTDGGWVAFTSLATNLAGGQTDTNAGSDVFLYDAAAGTTALVSHVPGSATTAANKDSLSPVLSADGAFVAFVSGAGNLIPGFVDANSSVSSDVYLFTRATGAVTLVSHTLGSATTTGDRDASRPHLSADGAWLAFQSAAYDLAAGQGEEVSSNDLDVFLYERATGQSRLVSHVPGSPSGGEGSAEPYGISRDGRFVAYAGRATGLVWHQTEENLDHNVFLYDRETGESVLVSRSLASPVQTAHFPLGNGSPSDGVFLSADGSTVLFVSRANDLVAGDLNRVEDLFAYDNGRIGSFYTLFPCRLIDTRRPQDGPALASNVSTVLHLFNACGIPETAKALAVNVTVVQPTAAGHLTLYRGEMTTPPVASTLNFGPGQVRANNAILRLAASAEGTLRVLPFVAGGGTVHVLVDVVGYFE